MKQYKLIVTLITRTRSTGGENRAREMNLQDLYGLMAPGPRLHAHTAVDWITVVRPGVAAQDAINVCGWNRTSALTGK